MVNFRKIIHLIIFLIPVMLSNCLGLGFLTFAGPYGGNPASVIPVPISLTTKIHGSIAFTGFQITDYDFLNKRWKDYDFLLKFPQINSLAFNAISSLNKPNREKMAYSNFERSEKFIFFKTTDSSSGIGKALNFTTIFVSDNSIPVFDSSSDFPVSRMWQGSINFLTAKSNDDYFLSITGLKCYHPNSFQEFPMMMIVSLYDRSGTKVFCNIYKRNYSNKFQSSDIDSAYSYYLKILIADCVPEINADLAALLKDADPPKGSSLEDLYQEYSKEKK